MDSELSQTWGAVVSAQDLTSKRSALAVWLEKAGDPDLIQEDAACIAELVLAGRSSLEKVLGESFATGGECAIVQCAPRCCAHLRESMVSQLGALRASRGMPWCSVDGLGDFSRGLQAHPVSGSV
jgi:hypothetical protein